MGLWVSDRASGSGCPSGPSEGVEGRGPGRELGREVRKGEEEVAGWAGREAVSGPWTALREKRKGRRAGLREKKRAMRRGRTGPGFWDWAEMLGFAMGFPFLFPISYFKHYSNLIELKFKFEFNPSTQTNKKDAPA